jgi:hypothetical protein
MPLSTSCKAERTSYSVYLGLVIGIICLFSKESLKSGEKRDVERGRFVVLRSKKCGRDWGVAGSGVNYVIVLVNAPTSITLSAVPSQTDILWLDSTRRLATGRIRM